MSGWMLLCFYLPSTSQPILPFLFLFSSLNFFPSLCLPLSPSLHLWWKEKKQFPWIWLNGQGCVPNIQQWIDTQTERSSLCPKLWYMDKCVPYSFTHRDTTWHFDTWSVLTCLWKPNHISGKLMYNPLWMCITLSQEWFPRVIKQQFGQAESLTLLHHVS